MMYEVPVNFDGTRVNARYGTGDFDIGRQLSDLNITMKTSGWGISVSHPFVKRRLLTVTGEAGLDAQDFRQDFIDSGNNKEDRTRVLHAGLDYDRQAGQSRNMARVAIRQGMGELFGGMGDHFGKASRAGADNGFSKMGIEVARFQRVTDKLSLIARGEGQVSSNTLVVGEQFSLGGPDSVRGYAVGEYLSDMGYRLSTELRLSPLMDKGLLQAVFFVDAGVGRIRHVNAGEEKEGSLTGTGFGVRGHKDYSGVVRGNNVGPFGVDVRADLGFPLEDGPVGKKTGVIFYFQALVRY
jgi:hemolysin activation/secretion protein